MLICVVSSMAIADVPKYEQKPHLEIKCPCGASFVTYEWLNRSVLIRADKFIETHSCAHKDNKKRIGYYPPEYLLIVATSTVFAKGIGDITIKTRNRDTGIKKLIGKMVHRTKPCGSVNDRSYITEPRKLLDVTDEYLILSSDILLKGKFEIDRNTWDDGNWKEWVNVNTCDLKIGDKVRTTSEYNKNFSSLGIIGKITNIVTDIYNKVATLDNGKRLDTDWLEKYDTK